MYTAVGKSGQVVCCGKRLPGFAGGVGDWTGISYAGDRDAHGGAWGLWGSGKSGDGTRVGPGLCACLFRFRRVTGTGYGKQGDGWRAVLTGFWAGFPVFLRERVLLLFLCPVEEKLKAVVGWPGVAQPVMHSRAGRRGKPGQPRFPSWLDGF
jgi:hypothetical protein